MPKPYPEDFWQDVVRVARNRGPGVTVEQVTTDFEAHPMTLRRWMRRADADDGTMPGVSSQGSTPADQAAGAGERGPTQGRGLSVAGASAGKRIYTLVKEPVVDRVPVTVTCQVLKFARQPYYRWLGKPVADAVLEEAYRANALFDAHCDDPKCRIDRESRGGQRQRSHERPRSPVLGPPVHRARRRGRAPLPQHAASADVDRRPRQPGIRPGRRFLVSRRELKLWAPRRVGGAGDLGADVTVAGTDDGADRVGDREDSQVVGDPILIFSSTA
ncbi:hypothetical protein [Streptomyces sp. NPDC087437]|uniref:hypothetical protein n=1 Tax=Streptomyces sp. NPDC087437 TaxID=3365789 RepID=UPI00380CFE10